MTETYRTSNLLPETNRWTTNAQFEGISYELPQVVALTTDSISFHYPLSRQTRTVGIISIHSATEPTTIN